MSGVAALALVWTAAACSSGDDTPSAVPKPPRTRSTVTTAPRVAAETPRTVLKRVSVQKSDLVAPWIPRLVPDGDKVAGQLTLNFCGEGYPSEQRRRFRRQVVAGDTADNATPLSTEAVLYDSPDGAAQAMTEVRAAPSQRCPDYFAEQSVAGEPPLQYEFAPQPDAAWPTVAGVERFVIDATIADGTGTTEHDVLVYLRRGRLLVGVYADPDAKTDGIAPSVGGLPELVTVIEHRMLDVSDSFVNSGGETI